MITLPSMVSKMVDAGGRLMPGAWNSYLQQFTQAPAPVNTITVGASPFAFTSRLPGSLAIVGGTLTAITLTRGTTVINLVTTNRFILMGINDIVTVSYSVLPVIQFLPLYGIAVR